MELPKLVVLVIFITSNSYASEHTHTIPVENYETELQDLGSHVESHEPPVKVIKITKTIAVKIPVPYPVKVTQKVPYPVHIVKPYPVPVPQIVHVPKSDAAPPSKPHGEHQALDTDSPHGHGNSHNQQESNQEEGHYEVQEPGPYSGSSDYNQHFGSNDDEHSANYNFPNTYGYSGANDGNYEQSINQYFVKQHPASNNGGNTFHYH